jgi:galactokinase
LRAHVEVTGARNSTPLCGHCVEILVVLAFLVPFIGDSIDQSLFTHRLGRQDGIADEGTALFLDARSMAFERVPLPRGADLVVLNSGVTHDHAAGDYNTRRAECQAAYELLGVGLLRDLTPNDLPRIEALPEPLCRRARHVVTENERVLRAVAAMRGNELAQLGELFYESHASMRDDYEVSVREVDLIVELARAGGDVCGARLTGAASAGRS